MKKTLKVPIRGMHCASCEVLIGESLRKLPGVETVSVNYKKAEAIVEYNGGEPSPKAVGQAVKEAGYEVGQTEKLAWLSSDPKDYNNLLRAGFILFIIYLVADRFNLFNLDVGTENSGVFVALLVGLVAGISTCMALIGGLVLGLSARHAELHPEATPLQKFRPHIYFNLGRILGYAILGGLIGFLGSAFRPSANILGFLTVIIGGVMIFFGLKLVEIFPVLKNKNITLPSGIAKIFGLNKEIKEYSPKSSMVTGALTFFLPCGFTQAMQLYAVSTGSFWQGMAIMGLFALGTAPGLLGIGGLTSVFKGQKAKVFFMTAGLLVIILGWTNVVNGSRLFSGSGNPAVNEEVSNKEPQEIRMDQNANGYSPNVLTVEKGRPVKWIINSKTAFSCAAALEMPKYGISKNLKKGENIITFTPTQVGEIPFSCSMGMYRGKFIVVDPSDKSASNNAQLAYNDEQVGSGGGCGGGNVVKPSVGSCGGSGGGCGGCGGGKALETKTGTATIASDSSNEQIIRSTYTLSEDVIPNSFTVKKGQPVKYIVDVKENGRGCMSSIMIPDLYNIPQRLIAGREIIMSFTPTETGDYQITCAMGMARGTIKVID